MGTGALYILPGSTLLNLRLIDTETSAIAKVFSEQYPAAASVEAGLTRLNREIMKVLVQKYPLRGFVVRADGGQVLINIGSRQGVTVGTRFEVLEEQKPIEYKGRLLKPSPKPVAELVVDNVDEDFSYASVVRQDKPFEQDAKIREKVDETAMISGGFNG
jgi:nitrogen regulatory protein PII-like uncharacterized protein